MALAPRRTSRAGSTAPLRIALLQCSPGSGPYREHDPPADPGRFLPEHDWTSLQLSKVTAVRELIYASRAGFDVYVNLCDGAWDEDVAGVEVPLALERLGLAYTGADPRSYDPSRVAMKLACHSVGVATPAFATARSGAEAANILGALRPPVIVKHPQGYSSIGMTRDSRVEDERALAREIDRTATAYGSALVEEFIEGREFSVLVADPAEANGDPVTFLPIEVLFPPGETFKHFDLKWIDYERMGEAPVADGALDAELRAAAAGMFAALGTTGYARVDLRLARDGTLHALEINPNCDVFYPEGAFGTADLILALDPLGHCGFLRHIIDCALRRWDARAVPVEVRRAAASGFGLFATRPLGADEIVQRGEEQPVRLVSRAYVRRSWSPVERGWFHRYAWPLTDGVHAIWPDDPEQWRPLNHSCDPNTWLRGLDLVTRRPVAEGEELTVDYATFTGPELEPFDCACGASACRGQIGPADHLDPALAARYGDHVSDYVRQARPAPAPAVLNGNRIGAHLEPFVVRVSRLGSELVATRDFATADQLATVSWSVPLATPTRWTVQRDARVHSEPFPEALRYLNHSCDPNVHLAVDENVLTALRGIEPGDPLQFFYPSTEWDMAEPFTCACGTERCIGRVAGAAHLDPDVLSRYPMSSFIAGAASAGR